MLKLLGAISAVIFSAIVAGAITGYPGFAETVSAKETIKETAPTQLVSAAPVIPAAFVAAQPATKLVAVAANPVAAPGCPNRGWPYQHCGDGQTKQIRLIPIDRLN